MNAGNASALADTLTRERERALLFRGLATLRTDIALFDKRGSVALERPHTGIGRARGKTGCGAHRKPVSDTSFPKRVDSFAGEGARATPNQRLPSP